MKKAKEHADKLLKNKTGQMSGERIGTVALAVVVGIVVFIIAASIIGNASVLTTITSVLTALCDSSLGGGFASIFNPSGVMGIIVIAIFLILLIGLGFGMATYALRAFKGNR